MIRYLISLFAAAVVATAAISDDQAHRCPAQAKVCEQQIRALLAGKPYFGARFSESRWGIVVKSVVRDSPAGRAGFVAGDRIFAVNGQDATKADIAEFKRMLTNARSNKVTLAIVRANRVARITVRLEQMTKEQVDKVVEKHLRAAHTAEQRASGQR